MKHNIWVEKYRPKTIKDVIFQDVKQQKLFESFVENNDIPNLLLSGIQGTGKTTISKALIKDLNIDPADVLTINCSDKKIDAMRHDVTNFAMTMPLGKFKVVRLEELDYCSLDAFGLLRGLIEDVSASCRFIATCNYENKIIPPLKSRFQQFYFKAPDKEKTALRVASILEQEGIDFDAEVLLTYVDVGYPDIRKTIHLLQANCNNGKLLAATETDGISDWKFGLLDCISTGNFKQARKLICESASREEHEDIFTFLYQNVDKMKVNDKESAIVTIAEYMVKHSLSSDTELNLAACMISLGKI